MLLNVFLAFVGLAALFLYFGYTHDIILRFYGFFILFLVGILMLTTGVEYITGSIATENIISENQSITTTVNTTADAGIWQGRTPGFFLALIAGFGFALTFFDLKVHVEGQEDED